MQAVYIFYESKYDKVHVFTLQNLLMCTEVLKFAKRTVYNVLIQNCLILYSKKKVIPASTSVTSKQFSKRIKQWQAVLFKVIWALCTIQMQHKLKLHSSKNLCDKKCIIILFVCLKKILYICVNVVYTDI